MGVHESSAACQDNWYDRMLFQDLVQKFFLSKEQHHEWARGSRNDCSSGLLQNVLASSAEAARSKTIFVSRSFRVFRKFACFTRTSSWTTSTSTSASQEKIIGGKIIGGKKSLVQSQWSMQAKMPCLGDQREVNQSRLRREDQELRLLQDRRLQEWHQGDLQGFSEKEVKEAIKKELMSPSSSGHEVCGPGLLRLLLLKNRWVKMGRWTSFRCSEGSSRSKGIHSSHWQGVKVCAYHDLGQSLRP